MCVYSEVGIFVTFLIAVIKYLRKKKLMKGRVYSGLFLERFNRGGKIGMNLGSCTIGAETLDSLLPASKDNVTTHPPDTSASMPSILMDCKSPNKNDVKIVFSVYKHGVFLHIWIFFSSFH